MIGNMYRLGIDFGTSTTVAAILRPGHPVLPLGFDASAQLPSAGFEVAASGGLDDVGGLDIDDVLVRKLRDLSPDPRWARLDWPTTVQERQARQELWRNVREAKERLSREVTAEVDVPLVGRSLHLTRHELETLAQPLLHRTVDLTLTTLRQAGIPPEDITGVFLVGGSSRIPLIATLLHRALHVPPTAVDDPQLVVAHGALLFQPVPPPAPGIPGVPRPREPFMPTGPPPISEPDWPDTSDDELIAGRVDGSPRPLRRTETPSLLVARHILPHERFRGQWRRHWCRLAEPATVAAASIPLGITATIWLWDSTSWLIAAAVVWLLVLSWTGGQFDTWRQTWLCLTDQRLLLIQGGRMRRSVSLALDRVTDVEYEQHRVGQILGFGSLIVESGNRDHQLRRTDRLPQISELSLRIIEQIQSPAAVAARLLED